MIYTCNAKAGSNPSPKNAQRRINTPGAGAGLLEHKASGIDHEEEAGIA